MVRELLQTFQKSDIRTRLNAGFRTDGGDPRVESTLWIDGSSLTFEPGPDGRYHNEIEVVVASYDPLGSLAEHTEKRYRSNLTEAELAEARRSGLVYGIAYKASKPGPYQVRVALLEAGSDHIGTASQFLWIPDLKKDELALSGIVVDGLESLRNGESGHPVMQLLRLGRGIVWHATLYHARLKKDMPNISLGLRVYRAGSLVAEVAPSPMANPVPVSKKTNILPLRGEVLLPPTAEPGEYVMQLIVVDENDKSKTITQALAFEVAP